LGTADAVLTDLVVGYEQGISIKGLPFPMHIKTVSSWLCTVQPARFSSMPAVHQPIIGSEFLLQSVMSLKQGRLFPNERTGSVGQS
jgi:hypothetical protein